MILHKFKGLKISYSLEKYILPVICFTIINSTHNNAHIFLSTQAQLYHPHSLSAGLYDTVLSQKYVVDPDVYLEN